MFRRRWSGLPSTPKFPADLEKLGYFINEDDELRNIEKPNYYFNYFLTKNTYINDSQRFSFHTAVQRNILDRLAALDVHPVRLPLGAAAHEAHVLVLASSDLATASRVLLFVGETAQDLGVLAHRVIGGSGGIDRGSIVHMVRHVRTSEENPPAILICNPGELFWWPDAQRSLSLPMCEGMPRPSAAHLSPRTVPGQNVVPGHETAGAHVASVFCELLGVQTSDSSTEKSTGGRAVPLRITAIGIAGGADALEAFLDDPERWHRWGPFMDSMVVLGGLYEEHHIKTDDFRSFLRRRCRAYIASEAPVDTPVAGAEGNDRALRSTRFGCPVHSAGTTSLTELMFIDAQEPILAFGAVVARTPGFVNPEISITYAERVLGVDDLTWANYEEGNGKGGWEGYEEKVDESSEPVEEAATDTCAEEK